MMDKSDNKSTGLRDDIERLLHAFINSQTVRYETFAEMWRNFNFTFIHYAMEKRHEKKEMMAEAFRIATDYLLPPYELQYRVAALYIIYGLYETQPHKPKHKIRMCLEHWLSIKDLIKTLKSQGHLDAVFVFNHLKIEKAFIFSAMPKKMIFHGSYMETNSDQNPTERWLDRHRHSLMTECFDDDTLEVNHELHEQYQKKKEDLGLHDNTSLMLVRESVTEHIVKRFEKLEASFEASREVSQTSDTNDPEYEVPGSRVSQIKKRSYTTLAETSKSRRHRQQAAPSSPKQTSTTTTKSKTKQKKNRSAVGFRRDGRRRKVANNLITDLYDDSSDSSYSPPSSNKKGPLSLQKRPKVKGGTSMEEKDNCESPGQPVSDDDDDLQSISEAEEDPLMRPSSKTRIQHLRAMSSDRSEDDDEAPDSPEATPASSPTTKASASSKRSSRSQASKNSKSSEALEVTKNTKQKRVRSRMDPGSLERRLSPENNPTEAVDLDKTKMGQAKRGRSQKGFESANQERNISPESSPKKKFKGTDKDTQIKDEDDASPHADQEPLRGRTPRISTRGKKVPKTRGGGTGAKTRGQKRR